MYKYKKGDKALCIQDEPGFFKKGKVYDIDFQVINYLGVEKLMPTISGIYLENISETSIDFWGPPFFVPYKVTKVVHKTEEDYYKWLASDRNYYE